MIAPEFRMFAGQLLVWQPWLSQFVLSTPPKICELTETQAKGLFYESQLHETEMVLSHPRLQLILGLDCWCPWSDLGERASLAALPRMLWAWTAVPTRFLPLT